LPVQQNINSREYVRKTIYTIPAAATIVDKGPIDRANAIRSLRSNFEKQATFKEPILNFRKL